MHSGVYIEWYCWVAYSNVGKCGFIHGKNFTVYINPEYDSYINISSTYIYSHYIRYWIIANRLTVGPNIYFLFK